MQVTISNYRSIRFMGPEAFDGEFAKRYGANNSRSGKWPSPENMSSRQLSYHPTSHLKQRLR